MSSKLTQASLDVLLGGLAEQASTRPVVGGAAPLGVEAVRRRDAHADYLFLLHHGDRAGRVDGAGTDLLTGERGTLRLAPGAVAVLREDRETTATIRSAED